MAPQNKIGKKNMIKILISVFILACFCKSIGALKCHCTVDNGELKCNEKFCEGGIRCRIDITYENKVKTVKKKCTNSTNLGQDTICGTGPPGAEIFTFAACDCNDKDLCNDDGLVTRAEEFFKMVPAPPTDTPNPGPPADTTTPGPPADTTTPGPPADTTTPGPPADTTTPTQAPQATTSAKMIRPEFVMVIICAVIAPIVA